MIQAREPTAIQDAYEYTNNNLDTYLMNERHAAFPQYPDSEIDSGLTKLEYIAIEAMKAIIQSADEPVYAALMSEQFMELDIGQPSCYGKITAKAALIYARALLGEIEENDSNNKIISAMPNTLS